MVFGVPLSNRFSAVAPVASPTRKARLGLVLVDSSHRDTNPSISSASRKPTDGDPATAERSASGLFPLAAGPSTSPAAKSKDVFVPQAPQVDNGGLTDVEVAFADLVSSVYQAAHSDNCVDAAPPVPRSDTRSEYAGVSKLSSPLPGGGRFMFTHVAGSDMSSNRGVQFEPLSLYDPLPIIPSANAIAPTESREASVSTAFSRRRASVSHVQGGACRRSVCALWLPLLMTYRHTLCACHSRVRDSRAAPQQILDSAVRTACEFPNSSCPRGHQAPQRAQQ